MEFYINIVNYAVYVVCFLFLVMLILSRRTIRDQKFLLKKLAEKNEELSFDFNSERDFAFMHHIITFELNNCLDTEMIMINEQKQSKLLKDDDLKSYVTVVCKASLEKMSLAYKDKLITKYFGTEEKFINYVTEYAFNTSLKLFSKLNKDKILKMRRINNTNNVINENNKNSVQLNKEMKDI